MLPYLLGKPSTRDQHRVRRLAADDTSASSLFRTSLPGFSSMLAHSAGDDEHFAVVLRELRSPSATLPNELLHQPTNTTTTRARRSRTHRSRNCMTGTRKRIYSINDDESLDGGRQRLTDFQAHQRQRDIQLRNQLELICSHVQYVQRRRALYESVLVESRSQAIARAFDITSAFYTLFARGLDRKSRPDHGAKAEAFLRTAMAEDIVCTEFVGVDTFLKQYEVSTQGHSSLLLELHDLRVLDDTDEQGRYNATLQVFAEATVRMRINRASLERFFPSIIRDEQLTQRLIGKEYVLQYDKVFHFRPSDGRIFQHESRIDFCASLLKMVGDPFLALQLVQASLITKHGHWKIDDSVEEDRYELENAVL